MLWIRFEFAMFQLPKKRNNIGIAAQLVPWRPVTEQENSTMPVKISLNRFLTWNCKIWKITTMLYSMMSAKYSFKTVNQ